MEDMAQAAMAVMTSILNRRVAGEKGSENREAAKGLFIFGSVIASIVA